MLPRLYRFSALLAWVLSAAFAYAGHKSCPADGSAAPCETTLQSTKVHLVPEQSETTLPRLQVREVVTPFPAMDVKIDFKEEKRTVTVTSVKPREEERVVTSTTMVPEMSIDPCTHCQTITYKPVCLSKTVKVTVMDCITETKEVTVRLPVLTPVESTVYVKQLAVDVTTVPAICTTYKAVVMPTTVTVPLPPPVSLPCLDGHCQP
jgi:hypothetical protein